MADKLAAIRATLDSSQFIGGLRGMDNATKAYGRAATHALKEAFGDGLKEAGNELKRTGGEIRHLMSSAVTLGGAFSFEEGIRSAVKMRGTMSDLAFSLSEGEKRQVSWNEVHEEVAPIADDTSQSVADLTAAYAGLYSATGNRDFAVKSLKPIGTIADASGKDVMKLAGIAGVLNEKFHITAEQLPNAMAAVMELASQGGVEFDELQGVLETTGASANAAGLTGEAGLKKMLAMANIGGDALKNMGKGTKAISKLLDDMVNPEVEKKIKQAFGVKVKDHGVARDQTKVLEDILVKTKGQREKLAKVFTGEQLKLVLALGADFTRTYETAKGTQAERLREAVDNYRGSLADAGKVTTDYAALQKMAKDRIDSDPAAALRKAMNKIEEAFIQPKMMAAVDKLAKKLPELAEALAKFVDFAVENPIKTGLGVIAGKTALDVVPGMLAAGGVGVAKSVLAKRAAGKAAGAVGEGLAALAPGAVPALAKGAGFFAPKAFGMTLGTGAVAGTAAALGAGALAGGAVYAAYDQNERTKKVTGGMGIGDIIGEMFEKKTLDVFKIVDEFQNKQAKQEAAQKAAPAQEVAPEIEKAVEGVEKHGKEADKAAVAISRTTREFGRLNDYLSTLSVPGGGGAAKGPVVPGATVPGATPRPTNL